MLKEYVLEYDNISDAALQIVISYSFSHNEHECPMFYHSVD
jgi:hypothetical protein